VKEEAFRSPGKEFRGAPFWSLNDRLEDGELRRQIALMDEGWFGGFFLHAREGLTTPYMTPEWLDRMAACVEEAERRGMYAWLYDEDKWPSGFGGGMVTAQRREYRAKALAMMISGRLDEVKEAIRVFECDLVDGKPENPKPTAREETTPGKNYLYFCLWQSGIGSKWYDGFAYLDTLNPEAVRAFTESTYKPYYRRLGKSFGSTIPGIFTDEPNIYAGRSVGVLDYPSIPWTEGLPEYFQARKGYDVRDHLPSLFFDVGDYRRVRYDFWGVLSTLFLEAFTKQLYDWCEQHGLRFTGHYLAEETLLSQIRYTGSILPHYEYMHVPGIDHLSRNITGFLTVKQVASVANQLGKERVLSETYGCSGQNLSFEDRKWIGDWEYVLGVNLLNHHLSLYTMRGRRKRDYPPTIFYQQPWWRHNPLIDAYFARLSYALSQGARLANVLVLHPIGSAWAIYSPLNARETERLHEGFEALCRLLLELHRDFELGDEEILAKHARAQDGRLLVGRCSYEAVLLPPGVTIAETTLRLLEGFIQGGGLLITVEPTPSLVEGKPSEALQGLLAKAAKIRLSEAQLLQGLRRLQAEVEVSDPAGRPARDVWYHLRRDGSQKILFLADTNRERGFHVTVRLKGTGRLEEWNPLNGDVKAIPSKAQDGFTVASLDLPPVGSRLLVLDEAKEPLRPEAESPKALRAISLERRWLLRRHDPNALTLDYCRVKVEDGEWGPLVPVWRAHRQVSHLGLGVRFSVQYSFEAALGPREDGRAWLVLETPERYAVKVNEMSVAHKEEHGWWVDTSFRRVPIGGLLRRGLNTVELEGRTGFHKEMIAGTDAHEFETEIEHAYIIGDFAVESLGNRGFRLVEEGREARSGDLVKQGYPFFAGTVSLTQELELSKVHGRAILAFEGLSAIVANVLVNDREAGQVFLRPHELDVTGLLKEGGNTIEVQLVGSLRNLLGPHHHKAGELFSVGPGSFTDELNWIDGYSFVSFGLEDAELLMEA